MRKPWIFGAAVLASAIACAAPPDRTLDLTIVRGRVPAHERVLRVDKGDGVRLRITGDAPGELHLHGYRLEAKVKPGAVSELSFKAHATGRYPFEWHPEDGKAARSHHGPPLAALEVRPK